MGFVVEHKLSTKQKAKRCEECLALLQAEGKLPPTADMHKALLNVHSLTQELVKDLQRLNHDTQAASKLAAHIEELIQSIKP